jgi:ElaB/YqjD/DUF883 family membrane-anchored ribosome-binding protein
MVRARHGVPYVGVIAVVVKDVKPDLEYPHAADYHVSHYQLEAWEVIMDGDATTSKDKLVSDLKNLVADAEELLKATASQAGERIAEARKKIDQSLIEGKKALADAEKTVRAKSKEYADTADDYVRENPWTAIGVAAGVGLVLGLLMRGK